MSVSSEYSSNPRFLLADVKAVEAVALAAALPATFTGDEQTVDLRTRFRTVDSHGDRGLLQDYQYFDGNWLLSKERDSLQLGALWHHDSTLYNVFENSASVPFTQRRTEQEATLEWRSKLTERTDLVTDVAYDRVGYGQVAQSSLANYRYLSASTQLSRALTERLQWQVAVGTSRYDLLNQNYRSASPFIQMALVDQLSEQWHLTLGTGVSAVRARSQIGPFILGPGLQFGPFVTHSAATTNTYAVSLQRSGAESTLGLSLNRAIQPSGFGVLVTQDNASLNGGTHWSERWSGSAVLRCSRQVDSLHQLNVGNVRYYAAEFTGNWLAAEQWTLTGQLTYARQRVLQLSAEPSGVTVYFTLARQFGRTKLH